MSIEENNILENGYEKEVYRIISNLSGKEDVSEDDSLAGDLGLDSFMMITLLIELEDAFEIEFAGSDMNPYDLLNVKNAIELVEKYIGG